MTIFCPFLDITTSTGFPQQFLIDSAIDCTLLTGLPPTDNITSPTLTSFALAGDSTPFSVTTSFSPITVEPLVFMVNPAGIPPKYKNSPLAYALFPINGEKSNTATNIKTIVLILFFVKRSICSKYAAYNRDYAVLRTQISAFFTSSNAITCGYADISDL
ncbi:unknown [Acidiphilium sp. CAG:727]|nr:unknown [Acidiphilium sp. CAG:727]